MNKFIVSVLLVAGAFSIQGQPLLPTTTWKFKTDGPIRSAALTNNDIIYVGTLAGSLYCISQETGKLIWRFTTDGAIAATPSIANSLVFTASRDNFIYALSALDGSVKWKFQMNTILPEPHAGWEYFTASPVVYDGIVYVGSGDGHLYALNANDGKLKWKYKTNGRIRTAPLIDDGTIYLPSNDSHLHVLSAKSGKLLWKFATDGVNYDSKKAGFNRTAMNDTPTKVDNTLIFGAKDGNVYALDMKKREAKWKFSYGTTWAMATTVHDGAVYAGWSTNNLTCAIDLNTGEELWKFQAGAHNYNLPLIHQGSMFFGSADGNLYKLNKDTGEKVWCYHVGREIYGSPIVANEQIIFGSDDGYLYALKEKSQPKLAIYQPDSIQDNTKYLVVDGKLTPYLVSKGFEKLDQTSLSSFIKDRIGDGLPSAIVFALPIIPDDVMGKDPASGPMRQYLEAGGKVIWTGDVPNYYALNNDGQFSRNPDVGESLLGVKYSGPTESGNYFAQSTQEGLNWGIPTWVKSTHSVVTLSENITPLAIDEYNRPAIWMKKFHPRKGSGYISCRTWSWNVPILEEDLELIYDLAIYGLK